MKIAIVHDWLTTSGGAERVLCQICQLFPKADLYTLIKTHGYPESLPGLENIKVTTSFLQKVPGISRFYRLFAPAMPRAVESFQLRSYDLVISSSWAFAHGAVVPEATPSLAYIHSPMRWAWDMEDEYLGYTKLGNFTLTLAKWKIKQLRMWDRAAGQRPNLVLANSDFVGQRIKNYWQRSANILYPPVPIPNIRSIQKPHEKYITVSRLVPYKRIDLWLNVFRLLTDRQLIIAGDGPELARLKTLAPPNVQFVGRLIDEELFELMHGARGFLQASKEDFGIAVVEAQSCGVPVLALDAGGARETILGLDSPNPTGMFFSKLDPEVVAQSILDFEKFSFDPDICRKNASRFSPKYFNQGLVQNIRNLIPGFNLNDDQQAHSIS